MYEEDKILGPFTFKQTVSLGVGFGLAYLAYRQLPPPASYAAAVLIGVAALAAAFLRFSPKKFDGDFKQHFLDLKMKTPPDVFQKMLQRKLAELQSQIQDRQSHGLPPDPKLEEVKNILESLVKE